MAPNIQVAQLLNGSGTYFVRQSIKWRLRIDESLHRCCTRATEDRLSEFVYLGSVITGSGEMGGKHLCTSKARPAFPKLRRFR